MSTQQLPGQSGLFYGRASSMDKRTIGKFTDRNHLSALHSTEPAEYDKKIIELYTQTQLISNDFLTMINKSTPYYLDGNTDTFRWYGTKPYEFPKVLSVPDSTLTQSAIGTDGKPFEIIVDTDRFQVDDIVMLGHPRYGQNIAVTAGPRQASGRGWLYEFVLMSINPQSETVSRQWLKPGVTIQYSHNNTGEFDQEGSGLDKLGDKLEFFETLGSGILFNHKETKWASERTLKDGKGNPLDILVYGSRTRGSMPTSTTALRWEPFVEYQMRKEMLESKVRKMIWAKPGTLRSRGARQELKKESAGVYWRMRNSGNYIGFDRGTFSLNLLKEAFGAIFYRREAISKRRVKMFTNEAGFDLFDQACKEDAQNSGINLVSNIEAVSNGIVTSSSASQNLVFSYNYSNMYSRATGYVELVHLSELDLPQTPEEFGQNKKSTPIFFIFNISPDSDGQLLSNVREVRRAGVPNMTWGYIDGRASHLGPYSSQGMQSANKFPGYEVWMEDRYDVFIEDMTRTFLIEENPQF